MKQVYLGVDELPQRSPRPKHSQWLTTLYQQRRDSVFIISVVTILCRNQKVFSHVLQLKGSVEKGITVFDDPKRSKVNKAFSSSNKFSRLKFNSWNCVLLKFSLVVLLGNKNSLLNFDLLRLSKTAIPIFPLGPSIAPLCFKCYSVELPLRGGGYMHP